MALLIARRLAKGPLHWAPLLNWTREHGLVVLVVAVGVAALAGGVRRLAPERWTPRMPRQVRPIRWWVMAAAVALVLVAVWATISVLLHVLPAPPGGQAGQPSSAQVGGVSSQAGLTLEIVKLGLAVGAGVGTAVALTLTARRQWLGERAQAHTEVDARERRLTDLYSDAAGKLGADSDPVVRLGALYSLERLAQAYPEHRQRIVNLICAYLRMPFTPPAQATVAVGRRTHSTRSVATTDTKTKADTEIQELQVRSTAQRILADHLAPHRGRWGRTRNPQFWPGMDLDLTGATLIDLQLTGIEVGTARFDNATFTDETSFGGATFTGSAWFDKTTFTDTWFNDAIFTGSAWFRGATFTDAQFSDAIFTDTVLFDGATFTGNTSFGGTAFAGTVSSDETSVTNFLFSEPNRAGTSFNRATFTGSAWFHGATFTGATSFDKTTFTGGALFDKTTFTSSASFNETTFPGITLFSGTSFHTSVVWAGARFAVPAIAADSYMKSVPETLEGPCPLGWTLDSEHPVSRRGEDGLWAPLVPVPIVLAGHPAALDSGTSVPKPSARSARK